MEFHGRPELARVLQKLFWSCQPTVNRFGFKRLRLESAFPELCLFFDKYFYNNSEISNLFFKGSPSIRLELEITISSLDDENINKGIDQKLTEKYDLYGYCKMVNMSMSEITSFKKEIFKYCERNLVKLFIYIPSPYVKEYILDQV